MKKYLSMLLCFIMLLSIFPTAALAEGGGGIITPQIEKYSFYYGDSCLVAKNAASEVVAEAIAAEVTVFSGDGAANCQSEGLWAVSDAANVSFSSDVLSAEQLSAVNEQWKTGPGNSGQVQGKKNPDKHVGATSMEYNPQSQKIQVKCGCGAVLESTDLPTPPKFEGSVTLIFIGSTEFSSVIEVQDSWLSEPLLNQENGSYYLNLTIPASVIQAKFLEVYTGAENLLPFTEAKTMQFNSDLNDSLNGYKKWGSGDDFKLVLPVKDSKDFSIVFHDGGETGKRPASVDYELNDGNSISFSAPEFKQTNHSYNIAEYPNPLPAGPEIPGYVHTGISETEGEVKLNYVLPACSVINVKIHEPRVTGTPSSYNVRVKLDTKDLNSNPLTLTSDAQTVICNSNGIDFSLADRDKWDLAAGTIIPKYLGDILNTISPKAEIYNAHSGADTVAFLSAASLSDPNPVFDSFSTKLVDGETRYSINGFTKKFMSICYEADPALVSLPADFELKLKLQHRFKGSEEFIDSLDAPLTLSPNKTSLDIYVPAMAMGAEGPLELEYRFVPLTEDMPYEADITPDPQLEGGFIAQLYKYEAPLVKFDVNFNWLDEADVSFRPADGIKVKLLRDGTSLEEITVKSTSDWKGQFAGVYPLTKADKTPYKYSISCETPSRYKGAVTENITDIVEERPGSDFVIRKKMSFTVTNTLDSHFTFSITKKWDLGGKDVSVPEYVNVNLLANNKIVDTIKIPTPDKNSDGTYPPAHMDFKKHFVNDEQGKKITYTVQEEVPEGFYVSYGKVYYANDDERYPYIELTNKPIPTFDLKVQKVWKNTVEPKDEIEIRLVADGENGDWIKVKKALDPETKKAQWLYTFEDLPELDSLGREIKYTVQEKNIRNFISHVSAIDDENTITITNTRLDRGVKTGDESNIGLWIGIAAAALLVIAVTAVVVIKKNKKDSDKTEDDQT